MSVPYVCTFLLARASFFLKSLRPEENDGVLRSLARPQIRPNLQGMKIAIASDHAGFVYKAQIKTLLLKLGHEVRDFSAPGTLPVDYPAFIRPAAESVARGEHERGIVLGGSGNGEAMVANKVRGIRCALCWNLETARWAREHNDANVLAIGERTVPMELALAIVQVWLTTRFCGGRHTARVKAIEG